MTVGVLLVDDHPVVLDGLQRALDAVDDLEVVGTAISLAEACAKIEGADVDVALIDLRLPDGAGTTLIAAAAARGRPATLVLSSFDHPTYVAAAVRLGAQGFLLKTSPMAAVVAAIRCVAAGGTSFSADHLREARFKLVVLRIVDRRIAEITTFGPALVAQFGLPETLQGCLRHSSEACHRTMTSRRGRVDRLKKRASSPKRRADRRPSA